MSGIKGKSGVYPKSEAHRAKIRATMKRKGIRPPKRIKEIITSEQLFDEGICPQCYTKMLIRKLEQREEGHYEWVTICNYCGATYVG